MELYPYRIRLRGPWQAIPVSRAATTIRLPCRCEDVWPGFRGVVRFTRAFGMPRKLDDYERVYLTIAGMTGSAEVRLNGAVLGHCDAAPFEIEVTGRLHARNQLEIRLSCADPDAGLWGEAALEIRCLAWLRNVAVEGRSGCLVVSGEAVGHADGPLDLYAILGRSTVIQATVTPTEIGTPFALTSAILSPEATCETAVRIELVSGAVAWHTQDLAVNLLPQETPTCPS